MGRRASKAYYRSLPPRPTGGSAVVDVTILVPVAGLVAVAVAAYLAWSVLRLSPGDEGVQGSARRIQEGARAFMRRQYRTIALIAAVITIIVAASFYSPRGLDNGAISAVAFSLGATL